MSKGRNEDRVGDPFGALKNSPYVVIDQQSNLLESCCKCFGCCCADTQNSYKIIVKGVNESDAAQFHVKEDSSCLGRMLCNPNHGMKLHVSEAKGTPDLLVIDRPFSCCCFAVGPCQKDIIVKRSPDEVIGYVTQPCCGGCLTPTLDMFTTKGGDSLGRIKGPCCCVAGCCKSEFDMFSPEDKEVASLRRGGVTDRGVGRSLLSTSDKYKLTFAEGADIPVDDKLVMIASTLFIDYLFFEGETQCLVNCCVCPPQCWFKLCELYCCGCGIPCRVKCCIDDVIEKKLGGGD